MAAVVLGWSCSISVQAETVRSKGSCSVVLGVLQLLLAIVGGLGLRTGAKGAARVAFWSGEVTPSMEGAQSRQNCCGQAPPELLAEESISASLSRSWTGHCVRREFAAWHPALSVPRAPSQRAPRPLSACPVSVCPVLSCRLTSAQACRAS